METADMPQTQESSHVEITNEDTVRHSLRYQGYCSLRIHSTKPVNQAYYVEQVKRLHETVRRNRPELWPNDWILRHDNVPAHKALSVKQFLAHIKCV
jgi:hypothetical protein